jgi:hypothetical protein
MNTLCLCAFVVVSLFIPHMLDGKQHVLIASGLTLIDFALR